LPELQRFACVYPLRASAPTAPRYVRRRRAGMQDAHCRRDRVSSRPLRVRRLHSRPCCVHGANGDRRGDGDAASPARRSCICRSATPRSGPGHARRRTPIARSLGGREASLASADL